MPKTKRDSLTPWHRTRVRERSRGQCEAIIDVERPMTLPDGREGFVVTTDLVPLRCTRRATEIHHALPRSRGGTILDKFRRGIEHLLHLCKTHHDLAHSGRATGTTLMIVGRVLTDPLTREPVYTGPDETLRALYPDPAEET